MKEKWYYLAVGIILSAAVFSLLSMASPEGSMFVPISETGLIVKEALKEDLDVSQKAGVLLLDYPEPFDGVSNVPGKIVYEDREYRPKAVSHDELKEHAGILQIQYLLSIGESSDGKFPVYFVSLGSEGTIEGIVVLNRAFPRGDEPFT